MKHFGVDFCSSSSIMGKYRIPNVTVQNVKPSRALPTQNLPGNLGSELCGKGRKLEMHTQSKAIRGALASLLQCRASRLMAITGCELQLCEQEKKMGSFVGKLLSFFLFLVFSLWTSNHPLAILNTNYLMSRLSAKSVCPMSRVYLKFT